jgi:hypothetical protein
MDNNDNDDDDGSTMDDEPPKHVQLAMYGRVTQRLDASQAPSTCKFSFLCFLLLTLH